VIGALLDRWLHTHWISLAGLILGTIAGFAQFIRGAMAAMKEQD
jgi:F0F1-type ATP synthase assembly protein I